MYSLSLSNCVNIHTFHGANLEVPLTLVTCAVLLDEVAVDPELASTEPWSWANTGLVPASLWHRIFVNQSILNLVSCIFCWKTPYRIYIVKSITSHPQPTAPCPTPGRSWPGPRFLSESRPKPSCSRSTNGSSPLCVGAILNNEISSGKRKNVKNMAVTTPWKGRLLAGWEQNRRQGTSFSASSGNLVFTDSTYLLLCPRPTTKALEVLIWGYK